MQETASISPISTNFWATDFRDSGKYANMGTSKHNECAIIHTILMLLKALIVRSTTQKDISLSAPQKRKCSRPGDALLSLAWNGQVGSYSHRRDIAHGQGGNYGIFLVLRPDLRRI